MNDAAVGKAVGHTSGCVSDVLRQQGLKPHRVRTYKVSRDPEFAAKVQDVVGLHLHPPEHAIVHRAAAFEPPAAEV